MESVPGRAGTHPHNCSLLKTDVIQEGGGGMGFSRDGTVQKALREVSPASTQALCGLWSINGENLLVLIIPTASFLESNPPRGAFEVLQAPM